MSNDPKVAVRKVRRCRKERITEVMPFAPWDGITVIRGTEIAHEFPVHVHQSYSIGIVETGARVIRMKGNDETIIQNGSGFVIEPGLTHSCESVPEHGHTYTVISVRPDVMTSLTVNTFGRAGIAPRFSNLMFCDRGLFHRIVRFWDYLEKNSRADRLRENLLSILNSLIRRFAGRYGLRCLPSSDNKVVDKIRRFLEANPHTNISGKEIAEVAELSEFHCNRTFRKLMGIPPHSYHLKIRIRKAQELISEGYSIVSAALETGFVDQSHFTHCFRRMVGVPPGQYRLYKHL